MNLIYDKLKEEVDKGLEGGNSGITTGFKELDKYILIRKRVYTLIFGASGTGKSALATCGWILNPFDWYWKNKATTKIKLKIVYFSMERSSVYISAKFLSRKIFLNEGIEIPVSRLLGWWDKKLSKEEYTIFIKYKPYFDNMSKVIEIIDGKQNPTGIYKWIQKYALENGKVEQINEFQKMYIPNDENLITIIVIDHQSLISREKGLNTKKEAIDKLSEYLQHARDFYGFSPVLVAQMNRDIANPVYSKMESFEPMPEQIKDSATSYEDCDVCLSLFDSVKFKTKAPTGHDADKLIDKETGDKYYRSLKIHKNSWGQDDIRKGMAFLGGYGHFKCLPKFSDTTEDIYKSILDKTYFLND